MQQILLTAVMTIEYKLIVKYRVKDSKTKEKGNKGNPISLGVKSKIINSDTDVGW
jgi:hypothetical protein